MWVLFLIPAALQAEECIATSVPEVSPQCNYVGVCPDSTCTCCDTSDDDDFCSRINIEPYLPGKWNHGDGLCDTPTSFVSTTFDIHVPDGLVDCPNDGTESDPSLVDEITRVMVAQNYTGIILALKCQICTSENPCTIESNTQTEGLLLEYGTDLNTYYDHDCALTTGTLPSGARPCDAKKDYGAEAKKMLYSALDKDNDYSTFRDALMKEITFDWSSNPIDYMSDHLDSQQGSIVQITRQPTSSPSSQPTSSPSPVATLVYKPCDDFDNSLADVEWLGAGASCRASMNESWTGGRTCESPYIVCLPEENTPALDIRGNPYKNNTHRYTVDECRLECSYDQGCLGIEFVADTNSSVGSCMLLRIEPEVEDQNMIYVYDPTATNLDKNHTGVNALCWSKRGDYCNPYFQAEDLTDEMLSCYCPNNRKGVYTKKVKRIVNNTRFCDNDSSVDERIKLAQANRMFHLCENWCLFETHNPEQENWYWDPWKQCWRETYSGKGVHRAYCDRVIRNPDSIELQFLNHRREHFCSKTEAPTSSPVPDVNTTWYLADVLESCDGVCGRNDRVCAAEQTTRRFKTEEDLRDAFSEAGVVCERVVMNSTSLVGWALPGLSGTRCVNRQPTILHLMDLDSDCHRTIGTGWRRLCACY